MIADCPNYIKGYRYQLWCEAKAASTRCCVVHVAAQEDECRQWNEDRLRAWGREAEIQDSSQRKPNDITKHGKDTLGNLKPESHTAIYGDSISEPQPSRSRSSSTDGILDEVPRPPQDDTMTLKSLKISSPTNGDTRSRTSPTDGSTATAMPTPTAFLPSTPLPLPTSTPPYSPQTQLSLSMRYEPPSPFSRWDTPLFTIPTTDAHPPYLQILDAIYPPPSKPTKKTLSQFGPSSSSTTTTSSSAATSSTTASTPAIRPHAATVLPSATSASALQHLESTTLSLIRALLTSARSSNAADGDGGVVTFPVPLASSTDQPQTSLSSAAFPITTTSEDDGMEVTLTIPPGTILTQPYLQRLRRKYTQVQRGRIAHGMGYVGSEAGTGREREREVVEGFVRFVEGEFGA